jgi:thioester reductase-like protein
MRPKAKIICLVRAETDEAARIRLLDVLAGRALSVEPDRLEVLSANVAKPHLGLSPETYARVAQLVGTVIHVRCRSWVC